MNIGHGHFLGKGERTGRNTSAVMQVIVVLVPGHVQVTRAVNHDANNIMRIIHITLKSGSSQLPFAFIKFSFSDNHIGAIIIKSDVLCIPETHQRIFAKDGYINRIIRPSFFYIRYLNTSLRKYTGTFENKQKNKEITHYFFGEFFCITKCLVKAGKRTSRPRLLLNYEKKGQY